LYRFDDRTVTGTEALELLDEAGYRPANLVELLAFGKTFPDEGREFPILAIGQSWRDSFGDLVVPYLCGVDDGRGLSVLWLASGFDPRYRFLVVRKDG